MSFVDAKSELNQLISELLKIEPYWKKCYPCMHNGKCCIGADISIRNDEWEIIKGHIQTLEADRISALKNQSSCPFRTPTECLIHDYRPLNCMYTPFQAVFNETTKMLHYSMSDEHCNCKQIETDIGDIDLSNPFIKLDNFGKDVYYLLLNSWFHKYYDFKVEDTSAQIRLQQL